MRPPARAWVASVASRAARFAVVITASGAASQAFGARPAGPDVSGEILYQIMPIAWRDSDTDPNRFGDFGGLIASLDYLEQLGITGIYLNPIFPSAAYHGYQHGDASKVNPWFGTEADFRGFVGAAHARNMRVYLDFVAYGISTDSVWFTAAYQHPSSQYSHWLAFTDTGNTKYRGYSFRTWNGDRVGFVHWNLDDPGPADLVTHWGRYWLHPSAAGASDAVDGFRLDHAFASAPEGWGANIGFWEKWASALRESDPNVFLFCEPGDWTSYGRDLSTPRGFDAAIAKPLEFAARDALKSRSSDGVVSAMRATLAAVPSGKTVIAELNDHDSDRIASVLGGDMARCKLAAAILLTQPFPPCIYSGDEIGMVGEKGKFGGDANDIPMREPFKWNAVAGPPMSDYFRLNAAAYEHRFERDHDGRSVEEQLGVKGSLLEEYRRLIAKRKGSPALQRGRYIEVPASDPGVWAFARRDDASGECVLVAVNLAGDSVAVKLDVSGLGARNEPALKSAVDAGELATLTVGKRTSYTIELGAYAYRIVRLSPAGSQGAAAHDH